MPRRVPELLAARSPERGTHTTAREIIQETIAAAAARPFPGRARMAAAPPPPASLARRLRACTPAAARARARRAVRGSRVRSRPAAGGAGGVVPVGVHRGWVRCRGQCAPGGAAGSAPRSGGARGSCPQVPAVPHSGAAARPPPSRGSAGCPWADARRRPLRNTRGTRTRRR